METTFIWNIVNLEREIKDGYVYTVHWTLSATNDDYFASSYGSLGLQRPEDELIAYENLTEELVVQWVKDALDVDSMESALES